MFHIKTSLTAYFPWCGMGDSLPYRRYFSEFLLLFPGEEMEESQEVHFLVFVLDDMKGKGLEDHLKIQKYWFKQLNFPFCVFFCKVKIHRLMIAIFFLEWLGTK